MKTKDKNLIIEAKAEDVIIETSKGITKIKICNNIKLGLEVDGDLMLKSSGDFVIAAGGELDLISMGKPICIESINSELHFNSRIAKPIKNLPESIEARQKMIKDHEFQVQIAAKMEIRNKILKDRVTDLEEQIKAIQQKIGDDFLK